MINDMAYAEGERAAWGLFSKHSAPLMQVMRGARVAAQTGTAPMQGAVKATTAGAGAAAPTAVGPGVMKRPAAPMATAPVPPPAAAPTPATPAAPATPVASAAAPAAAPSFLQSLKEQAPSALLNTGLMMGIPMAMNAFSGSGNQGQ